MATITLTIPDDLFAIYQRFQQENGAQWAEVFLAGKLRELAQRFDAADADILFHAMPKADRDAILEKAKKKP